MAVRVCTDALMTSMPAPRRDRRLPDDCVDRHNCRRIVTQRNRDGFLRTASITPQHTSLTHGSTRPPRRRCRLGSGTDSTHAAFPCREPTQFVGDRLPTSAQHVAEHFEPPHAHTWSAPGPVAAATPGCRWPSRASAPSPSGTARFHHHTPTNRWVPQPRDDAPHAAAIVPLARRQRSGTSSDPHGSPARLGAPQ